MRHCSAVARIRQYAQQSPTPQVSSSLLHQTQQAYLQIVVCQLIYLNSFLFIIFFRMQFVEDVQFYNMATASSHDHPQKQHLPPSPPPSPPSTRRRHKKKLDPFEELASAPIPSPPSSPPNELADEGSLLTKVSFLRSRIEA